MNQLKFKTETGEIKTINNCKLSTGGFDKNGVEIWEGDTILVPTDVRYKGKTTTYNLRFQVVLNEAGSQHNKNNTLKFDGIKLDPLPNTPKGAVISYNWGIFSKCEVVNS